MSLLAEDFRLRLAVAIVVGGLVTTSAGARELEDLKRRVDALRGYL